MQLAAHDVDRNRYLNGLEIDGRFGGLLPPSSDPAANGTVEAEIEVFDFIARASDAPDVFAVHLDELRPNLGVPPTSPETTAAGSVRPWHPYGMSHAQRAAAASGRVPTGTMYRRASEACAMTAKPMRPHHHCTGGGSVILVFGATGNVGGTVVRELAAAGSEVRAVVRQLERATLAAGVEAVAGDLADVATLRPSLAGVEAAFLMSGYRGIDDLVPEMTAAGVERVVLLSSSAAPSGDLSNAVARYHLMSEQVVRDAGVAWTFLQPNSFMTNTFQWIPQLRTGDVVRAPFANVAVATIDPADVAAVAARALVSADLEGRSLRLSGPEALRPADRVRILATALGRDLQFEAVPNDAARKEMTESMPVEYVDAFFSFFVDGIIDETTVQPTVREVLGREPRSFAEWVAMHQDRF